MDIIVSKDSIRYWFHLSNSGVYNIFKSPLPFFTLFRFRVEYPAALRRDFSLPKKSAGYFITIACITGGIAEAFYKEIPVDITDYVSVILGPGLMKDVIIPFSERNSRTWPPNVPGTRRSSR
jgi:hypothetical protein